jgi:glycerol-3-phosphate acyltransferase PlsY
MKIVSMAFRRNRRVRAASKSAYCRVTTMEALLHLALGYLAGSVPFALIVSRAMGLPDPRTYGSGNIGATNVLRSGSKAAAALTLAGDAAKGWLVVWLAMRLGSSPELVAIGAIGVFLGHVFTVWLKFQGGKGVATAAGVILAYDPVLALAVAAVWLTIVVVTRYSSLGAITAAVFAPALAWTLGAPGPTLIALATIGFALVWRHEANIRKLLKGEERRIGEGKKPEGTPGGSA